MRDGGPEWGESSLPSAETQRAEHPRSRGPLLRANLDNRVGTVQLLSEARDPRPLPAQLRQARYRQRGAAIGSLRRFQHCAVLAPDGTQAIPGDGGMLHISCSKANLQATTSNPLRQAMHEMQRVQPRWHMRNKYVVCRDRHYQAVQATGARMGCCIQPGATYSGDTAEQAGAGGERDSLHFMKALLHRLLPANLRICDRC